MPTFAVALNTTSFDRGLAKLKEQAPKAIARALNRAINSGRTAMKRAITEDLGSVINQSSVNAAMFTVEATPERHTSRLSIRDTVRIPLIDFGATGPEPSRGRGSGVTYRLSGSKKRLPHAFITTLSSGHRGVFERTPGKYMRSQKSSWRVKRQAIHEKFGPSLPHVFVKCIPIGLARGVEALITNLEHEFQFAMREAAS